ncbi:MAG: LysR substrate-binding domain-containing protein [Minicystis sp.]
MELSDIEVFQTVVAEGGVIAAARRLHRVPSNVTTRVRKLEEELGVPLFLREKNRLRLAPAGRLLLPYAERLLALSEEARQALRDPTPRGPLRLGSMESTAAVRLPRPLAAYHKRFPEVAVELRTGPSQKLVAAVLAGELDAALVADPGTDPRLTRLPVFREELVLVTEASRRDPVTARDLAGATLLAFADGCAYRRRLEAWLADASVVPERTAEIASYHAMLGCVVAGMGVALVPRSVLQTLPARSRTRAHPLPKRWRWAETILIWRREAGAARIEALAEVMRSEGQRSTHTDGTPSTSTSAVAGTRLRGSSSQSSGRSDM